MSFPYDEDMGVVDDINENMVVDDVDIKMIVDDIKTDSNISNTLPNLPDIKLPNESIFTKEFMFANMVRKCGIREAYDTNIIKKNNRDTQKTYECLHKWLYVNDKAKSIVMNMVLDKLRDYSYVKPVHVIKFYYSQASNNTTMYSLIGLYPSLINILKEYIVFSSNILEVIHTEYPVQKILTAIFNDYYSRRNYTYQIYNESYDIGENSYEWYFISNSYKGFHLLKNSNLIATNIFTICHKYCVDINDVSIHEIKN